MPATDYERGGGGTARGRDMLVLREGDGVTVVLTAVSRLHTRRF